MFQPVSAERKSPYNSGSESPLKANEFRSKSPQAYKAEILKLDIPYVVLSGTAPERLEKAMEIFSNYFN